MDLSDNSMTNVERSTSALLCLSEKGTCLGCGAHFVQCDKMCSSDVIILLNGMWQNIIHWVIKYEGKSFSEASETLFNLVHRQVE